jgi:AraC-like DNA-binding protein
MKCLTEKPSFISTQVRGGRYLFLDLRPRKDAGLAVVCAGREECTPDYYIHRHGFRYHAVEYVIGGQWELRVGRRRTMLGPGSLFSYGPNTDYTLRAAADSGLVKCFVDFTGSKASALLKTSGLNKGRALQIPHTRWLHDLFDQILDCANLSRSSAREIGARLTELFLLRIREEMRLGLKPQSKAQRTYARCREFIQANYLELTSVAEIAEQCNLDPAYLSRLFKRFADENPLQFLTRLKMDQAAELILRNAYGVKQAGATVGFGDPYHFSRAFKRVHGVAPGLFSRS